MSQSSLPRYVLDASVAIKWYLPDESNATEANELFTDFFTGQIELVAPDHINYEISNVLATAVRRGRVTGTLARDSLLEFLSLPVGRVGGERLALQAYDLARTYDCAAYDGLYLALSSRLTIPLVHADTRLSNTLAGRFPHELPIENYE